MIAFAKTIDPLVAEQTILDQIYKAAAVHPQFRQMSACDLLQFEGLEQYSLSRNRRKLGLIRLFKRFHSSNEVNGRIHWMRSEMDWDEDWLKDNRIGSAIILDLLFGVDGMLCFDDGDFRNKPIALDVTMKDGRQLSEKVRKMAHYIRAHYRPFFKTIAVKISDMEISGDVLMRAIARTIRERSRGPFLIYEWEGDAIVRLYNRYNHRQYRIVDRIKI